MAVSGAVPNGAAVPEIVWVRKIKRGPRRTTTWPCHPVGQDEHGVWLYVPPGSRCRGVDGDRVTTSEVAMDADGRGRHRLCLVPRSGWWVAHWTATADGPRLDIDMSTPAEPHPWGWSFYDLELDPHLDPSGNVGVDDRDEFDDAVRAGTIGPHEAAAVEREVDIVTRALTGRREPFGTTGIHLLTRLSATAYPPLRAVDHAPS